MSNFDSTQGTLSASDKLENLTLKAVDLRTLNRWLYLLEYNAHMDTQVFANSHGIDAKGLQRAKKIIAGLSENLDSFVSDVKEGKLDINDESDLQL